MGEIKMSERYEMSYSDNSLLMTISASDVKTPAEREALEIWKMAEAKRSIKNEQLMFLNQVIREYPSNLQNSDEFKEIQEEARKCAKDISSCDREECKLRSGILKPLAKQIFKQVQFRYDLEPVLIRKHDLNYVQALERLYAKEAQTLEGKLNQKNAESSPMICALDQQIHKITQEIKQIEGDLSKFKWCWSKEKRTQKENLTERLSNLSSYAQRLHAQRRLWSVIR